MKKDDLKKQLIAAARIAISHPKTGFWADLEQAMNDRSEAAKALVKPRKSKH